MLLPVPGAFHRVVIQVEPHSDLTAGFAVEQLVQAMEGREDVRFDRCIVAPTADDFTETAKELAAQDGVVLVAGRDLARWLLEAGLAAERA